MMLEAQICLVIGGIIIVVLLCFFYRMENEVEFDKQCTHLGGKTLRTNDGPVCIKSNSVLLK